MLISYSIVFILRVWLICRFIHAAFVHCFLCQEVRYYFLFLFLYSFLLSNPFRFESAVFLTVMWSIPSIRLTSFGKGIVNAVFFARWLFVVLFVPFSRYSFRFLCCCDSILLSVLATYVGHAFVHPRARKEHFNRRKPPNCEKCGYHLGRTNESVPKKPKRNCPSAVFSWVRFTFLVRRARRLIVVSS